MFAQLNNKSVTQSFTILFICLLLIFNVKLGSFLRKSLLISISFVEISSFVDHQNPDEFSETILKINRNRYSLLNYVCKLSLSLLNTSDRKSEQIFSRLFFQTLFFNYFSFRYTQRERERKTRE